LVGILKPLYDSLNNDIQLIVEATEVDNWDSVKKITHKLKSSVGYIKANELFLVLQKMEMNSMSADKKDLVKEDAVLMKRLADEVKRHLALEIKVLMNELAVAC